MRAVHRKCWAYKLNLGAYSEELLNVCEMVGSTVSLYYKTVAQQACCRRSGSEREGGRHVDAGYPEAIGFAKEHGVDVPMMPG